MYLLAYLRDDEVEILQIAADTELLDKRKANDDNQFLDVLLEKGLVTVIDSKVAKREGFAGQDVAGRYADGSKAGQEKSRFLRLNTFNFTFAATYSDMFDQVSRLKHFEPPAIPPGEIGLYKKMFKFLIFVPVNDCKYASKVAKNIHGKNDLSLFDNRVTADGDDLCNVTPILYFRPLPYEFQFRRDEKVGTVIYIR